jgi:hypothetical protein
MPILTTLFLPKSHELSADCLVFEHLVSVIRPTSCDRRLHDFTEYLDAATSLSSQHGIEKNIFIATDDENVIHEIQRGVHQKALPFTFYFLK